MRIIRSVISYQYHLQMPMPVPLQLHARGLKLGIYADFGTATCSGLPGSEFYLELDARTFAAWGVVMVKLDACNCDPPQIPDGYEAFGFFLNATGRQILFDCSWPADLVFANITVCQSPVPLPLPSFTYSFYHFLLL